MRIIAENKCNEKKIDSKVGVLSGTKPCKSPVREADQVIHEPVLPSSSDNDEIQVALSTFSTFIHTGSGIRRHHHCSGGAANSCCPQGESICESAHLSAE
jgi:hypothetical protein